MREPSFWWRPAGLEAALLAPISAIYGAIAGFRMGRPGKGAGVPIICVGNFTIGGAGKTPTAMCVNEETTICTTYLDHWTERGWTVTDLTCPVPPVEQLLGSPPVHQCRVLEFAGT